LILYLAGLAVLLYILELFRVVPAQLIRPFLWLNFAIDFIFFLDLTLKCVFLGRSYVKSPWFVIDFISTLPIISSTFELLGNLAPQLQATRVARASRIARIARVARLAKVARVARLVTAIRARQGLHFLKIDENQETPHFNRALLISVPLLLIAFIFANHFITVKEVANAKEQIQSRLDHAKTQSDLEVILSDYEVSQAYMLHDETWQIKSPLDPNLTLTISLSHAYARANRTAGIMLLVLLATIGLSVYLSLSLSKDRSSSRERSILTQCFSPVIVDKFYSSPEIVERYFNHWMTVFFVDIRGFTKTIEKEQDDVEGFAIKLRKVMDAARKQIVDTHKGVVDKFMGDAVMGWVGGHFSTHWGIQSDVRDKLCLDELDLINQDIKKIEREISNHKSVDSGGDKESLRLTLEVAKKEREKYLAQQELAKRSDHDLEKKFEKVFYQYKKAIARTAVTCCLTIVEEVRKIEGAEGLKNLKIGIGSGPVLVGNFGSSDHIAFTVLGPTVNRSARLEPASARAGCEMLIDQNTYDLLKDHEDFSFRKLPAIPLKGILGNVSTYEPFFAGQVPEQFLDTFNEGVEALANEDNAHAIECFTKAAQYRKGGDPASEIWREFAARKSS